MMMVVAIDGPSGAGKTTVSRMVAQRLGLAHLDTGAMYRAVTLVAIESGVDPSDEASLAALAAGIDVVFDGGRTLIGGRDVTEEIRSRDVTRAVSQVAAHPSVREPMVAHQRRLGVQGAVVEGRDIGTVVFKDALLKIFLTASEQVRAARRAKELEADPDTVERAILDRDKTDSEREVSPLKPADDSIELDTTSLSLDEVVDEICSLFLSRSN